MKQSAWANEVPSSIKDDKDMGKGKWIAVTSPEQLFRLNADVDFRSQKYSPLNFNMDVDCDGSTNDSDY